MNKNEHKKTKQETDIEAIVDYFFQEGEAPFKTSSFNNKEPELRILDSPFGQLTHNLDNIFWRGPYKIPSFQRYKYNKAIQCIGNEQVEEAIKIVEGLLAKRPNTPFYYDFLYNAYHQLPAIDEEKIKSFSLTSKEKFPDLLLIQCNYLHFMASKGQDHIFEEVFPPPYDLHEIFPKRNSFYTAEIVLFFTFIASFLVTKKHSLSGAEACHKFLAEYFPKEIGTTQLGLILEEEKSTNRRLTKIIVPVFFILLVLLIWGFGALIRYIF